MPRPRRRKGESESSYISRLVRHYIHEGYPRKQAIAIAYSVAKRNKRKKRRRNKRRKSR